MSQDSRVKKSRASSGFKRAEPPRVAASLSLRARALKAYGRQAGPERKTKTADLDSTDLGDLNLEDLLDSDPEAA